MRGRSSSATSARFSLRCADGIPDEVVERIAEDLKISDDVQNELLPSGEPRYRNQVAWARFYLAREGLLDSSKRGVWSLTERGRSTTLTLGQAREIFLKWVKIFQEARRAKATKADQTEEAVAEGHGRHAEGLSRGGARPSVETAASRFRETLPTIAPRGGFHPSDRDGQHRGRRN
jgi:restriction endonuclease Mrr